MADLSSSPRKPFHERVVELETELYKLFTESFYPEQSERERLANAFGIDEEVIQAWFQKKHAEWPDLGDDAVLKGVAVGSPEAEGFSRRKILRLAQDCVLEEAFIKDPNLITSDSAALARQLNVDQLVVALWLADKRAEAAKPKPKEKFDWMCFPVEVQQAQIKARGDKKFTVEQEAALKEIYKLIPNPDGYVLITKIAKKLNLPYVFTERWFEVQRLRERRTTRKTCGQLMAEYEAEIWIAGEETYLSKGEDYEAKDFDRMAYDEGQRLGLEYYFKTMQHPDVLMREEIGEKLKLCPLLVKAWFVEKRACERLKAFETLQNVEWTMPPGPIFNHDDVELTIDHYFPAEAEKGLKQLFEQKQFITSNERAAVAEQLGLTQFHTELWFEQERRNDRKARENAKKGQAVVAAREVPSTAKPVAQVTIDKAPKAQATAEPVVLAKVTENARKEVPLNEAPQNPSIDAKTRHHGRLRLATAIMKNSRPIFDALIEEARLYEEKLFSSASDRTAYYTLATQEEKLKGVAEYAIVKSIELVLETSEALTTTLRNEMIGHVLKAMLPDEAEFMRRIMAEAERLEQGVFETAPGAAVVHQQKVLDIWKQKTNIGEYEVNDYIRAAITTLLPDNPVLAKEVTEHLLSFRMWARQPSVFRSEILGKVKVPVEPPKEEKKLERPKTLNVVPIWSKDVVPKIGSRSEDATVDAMKKMQLSEEKNKEMVHYNYGSAHSDDEEDEDVEMDAMKWAQKQTNKAQQCLDYAESLYRGGSKAAALKANERGLRLCQIIAATEKQLLVQLGSMQK